MNILVINCGSSSIKYQLINTADESCLLKGLIEKLEPGASFIHAIKSILDKTGNHNIDAVGHRVVHGGDEFRDATFIDDDVIEAIERWSKIAPLHNPANLAGIQAAQEILGDIPHIAVFDTAFHARLPRRASHYAIDPDFAEKHHIKRFGFHGTSHAYVADKAAEYLKRPLSKLRIISLHLGNGASACAIEFGHSTDTSMGMTPLEGLAMGTRSGDIDPGILLHLINTGQMTPEALEHQLNHESGLKGLSGISNDLRDIEAEAEKGNDKARLAISVYAHKARKYIGAYAAAMGGVDAIVMTGGIGENSPTMRHRLLQRLEFLGIVIDEDKNNDTDVSHEKPVCRINSELSNVHLLVIKTNEELRIAQQTAAICKKKNQVNRSKAIPIAVSARHIHLDRETFKQLFGEDAEPTHYKDLVQPGQYACRETVNLIGPRGRIENVRLLGPLRSKNQVEVSRTDEFILGVDAPVRDSGRTKGSAPITVEGPAGSVHLTEGLICARRHIHMHTDDAEFFGVKDKDIVEVAITGGIRDLIFGDVLIRVSPGYKLEMHIDTDEANAAELDSQHNGELVYTGIEDAQAELRSRKATN